MVIFPELLSAYLLSQLDKRRVAGIAERLQEGLRSVSGSHMAMDGPGISFHHLGAGANKSGILIHYALLQTHSRGDDLKHRAGVIGIADRLISPLLLDCLAGSRVLLVLRQGVYGLLYVLIHDSKGVVRVEIPFHRHAIDLTGIYIHHNGGGTVLNIIIDDALFQILFHKVLDGLVDGQHQAVAILRRHQLLVIVGHIGADGVFGRNQPACRSGKGTVIIGLQARKALVVSSDASKHR